MEINLLNFTGITEAICGLQQSYKVDSERAKSVAKKFFNSTDKLYSGELKFMEFICIYLEIKAPRYWWQQFDTYRIGISKQSESTMHTIMKRKLAQDDFAEMINPQHLEYLNDKIAYKDFDAVKNNLPEGFLQRRIIKTDVKTLKYIIEQRKNHRLNEWQIFCKKIKETINYIKDYELPEF